jgi:hypothetical protein
MEQSGQQARPAEPKVEKPVAAPAPAAAAPVKQAAVGSS